MIEGAGEARWWRAGRRKAQPSAVRSVSDLRGQPEDLMVNFAG